MVALGIIILGISLLLALMSVYLSFRLIKVTGKLTAWVFISTAIFLMFIRRLIPFLHLTMGAISYCPDLINESFGLLLSALMVIGAWRIGPLFLSIKQSEKELDESKKWFLTTLHSIGDAVIATDTRGYITFMNPAAEVLIEQREKDSIGKPINEILVMRDEKTGQPKEDLVMQVLKKKEVIYLEEHVFLARKNGDKLFINDSAAPIKDEQENIIGVVLVFRDITERKLAEDALENVHQEFKQIFNTAADGMRVIDKNFKVIRINNRFSSLVGVGKDKIINHKCYEIFPGSTCHTANCSMKRILEGEDYIEYDVEKERVDKSKIFCIMTATPLRGADGELIGIVENFKDVTERKRIADRLRSLGEMATGIVHELNQPLVGVRGLAEHILLAFKRGWSISEDIIKEKVQLIIDQTDRMSYVIEHARIFAKGADNSALVPVQVNEVIKSALGLTGAQLRSKGLRIKCEFNKWLPQVPANPFSLEEVILNLLSNAYDAFPDASAIDQFIDQSRDYPHILVRTFEKPKGLVKIEVIDYGQGIPADLIPRVFDPFFTTKSTGKGTGLGLSISKSIIENFRGTIDIQSSLDAGTTVTISLPILKQNEEEVYG